MSILVALCLVFLTGKFGDGQTDRHEPIDPFGTTANTGSKPQSKVWIHKGEFYAVFPNSTGTHVWKLSGNQWNHHLILTSNDQSKADCFATSDMVFMLLFQGENSEFTVLKFDEISQRYQFLDPAKSISRIVFDPSTETASIAFDSHSVLWITYEADTRIEVRNSRAPYTSWSSPEPIFSGVADDDISGIVKMSNSVGVLWSNQNSERFGFKFHVDGDPMSTWSADEVPASQSALKIGDGMADDHINLKYTSEGELFAAIKTSYDTPSYTKIGLLVRRSDGTWDDLYHVSDAGTRPIVAVDTLSSMIKVYYTSRESGGAILVKESAITPISFGKDHIFLDGKSVNNASSTKFPYACTNLVIASDAINIVGGVAECR